MFRYRISQQESSRCSGIESGANRRGGGGAVPFWMRNQLRAASTILEGRRPNMLHETAPSGFGHFAVWFWTMASIEGRVWVGDGGDAEAAARTSTDVPMDLQTHGPTLATALMMARATVLQQGNQHTTGLCARRQGRRHAHRSGVRHTEFLVNVIFLCSQRGLGTRPGISDRDHTRLSHSLDCDARVGPRRVFAASRRRCETVVL